MEKYGKMLEKRKEMSSVKVEHTKKIIEKMIRNNNKITFYTVAKKADCSRNFLYKNIELRELIINNRESELIISKKDEKTIINSFKEEYERIKKENDNYCRSEKGKLINEIKILKIKIEKLEKNNKELTEENHSLLLQLTKRDN